MTLQSFLRLLRLPRRWRNKSSHRLQSHYPGAAKVAAALLLPFLLILGLSLVAEEEKFLPLLKPIAEDEDAMLGSTASPRKSNSRLSCQLHVTPEFDGLVVHTPPTQQ